ncbi:TIGR03560 family F420-dependent LLM class oxidoreductase [Streptomyces asiaticus]|uniref:TIGR03560 family F420-dependent LLM class oxidoreductase n=1 Tax=Streptomyces asiaticus TaxID=114695 RepID=UPI003F670189
MATGISVCAFIEPHQGADHERILRFARTAEEAGFEGLFVSDHYLAEGDVPHSSGPSDAWLTLSALCRETTRLRLGTLMSCATFRLPGALAVAGAQLDRMSGGRFEVGIGAGWYEAEHRTHGIPFPPVAERFERLAEQMEILRLFWQTNRGERFSYDGAHYRLEQCPALPTPVQRGGPPLIAGGRGPRRSPAIAARHADEFNVPFAEPDLVAAQMEQADEACQLMGRDPRTLRRSTLLTICCGTTEADVAYRKNRMRPYAGAGRAVIALGSPDVVRSRLEAYAALGLHRIYLQFLDIEDLEQLHLIGTEVIPYLRRTTSLSSQRLDLFQPALDTA